MTWVALGLDLSLSNTGCAVLNGEDRAVLDLRSIKTTTSDGTHIERCDWIAEGVGEVVLQWRERLNLIVIEDYGYSRPTMLATLGELGGIVKRELWKVTGVPECWMTMTSSHCAKEFTGSGGGKSADRKARMLAAARPYMQNYASIRDDMFIQYDDDNLADAIGLADVGIAEFGPGLQLRTS